MKWNAQVVGQNKHILYIEQIETSYPVTANSRVSINNKMAKAATGQSPMDNLRHLSADYSCCDGP